MICENCGQEYIGENKRFCSIKCAKSFSTKNDNKQGTKEVICVDCGNVFCVNKRTNNKYRCKSCKEYYLLNENINNTRVLTCKICGRKYIKEHGGCNNEFCKNHNILGFNNLIKYFGFDKNKLGTLEVEQEFDRVRNTLYDLYVNKKLTSKEISKIYNVDSKHCLSQTTLLFLDIPIRDFKETSKNAYLNGKLGNQKIYNQYKSGKHITWNNKEVFLRSSYEFEYAKELDSKQIEYEVEFFRIKYFDTIKNEYCIAVPDFYIPSTNTIVEIKSKYTLNIQNMKDKFSAYKNLGYNTKLILNKKEVDLYLL